MYPVTVNAVVCVRVVVVAGISSLYPLGSQYNVNHSVASSKKRQSIVGCVCVSLSFCVLCALLMHSSSNCVAIDRQMAWVSVGCLLNHSKGEAEGNQVYQQLV
jgi:hypothetical protein